MFASPTLGGLYFWVCKMKPDLLVLGCASKWNLLETQIYASIVCTGWIYTIAMVFTGTAGNLR